MANQQQYSEEDLEGILRLAVAKQPGLNTVDQRARLASMAAELGISADVLASAESEYAAKKTLDADLKLYHSEQKGGFVAHLIPYLIFTAFFIFKMMDTENLNFLWGVFGWGIGVFFHGYSALRPVTPDNPQFALWRSAKQRSRELTANYGLERVLNDLVVEFEIEQRGALTKIEAIKRLRERTGLGLSDSKLAVDDYAARHPGKMF
ncbi:MAG: 2TM domain-containing protein [Fimbriimonadaceae bacterium]|nr:2TM domain-containing protein [Fimbriimonadaceae bacterium]